MHDLRAGRRMLLCRIRTLLSVWSGLLPADLEDFVSRYPVMVKMFSQEPALVVISAMWKFGPARDALATAWCTVRRSAKHGSISTVGGLTSAGPASRVRALRLYSVLVEAVKLLSHVDMSMWAINAGKGFPPSGLAGVVPAARADCPPQQVRHIVLGAAEVRSPFVCESMSHEY